jgi:hypothetical protein
MAVMAARHAAAALSPAGSAERVMQCRLLRDILGPPCRTWRVDRAWLTWGRGVIGALAGAIYERHRFGELPVLADALEDAGCVDADVLAHCRDEGMHVRGCWVVDGLLGWR